MKNQEINDFIYRYLEKYKTQSAIMLTGEWGSGKSYYIRKDLIPFLEEGIYISENAETANDNGNNTNTNAETTNDNKNKARKYKCIVISLYGLSTVEEISRSIYFEARTAFLKNQAKKLFSRNMRRKGKEIWAFGSGICKTLFKNFSGIELDTKNQDFDSLIETINMKGKLIILEDIERTKIDILDLLGYINSLVEQDGVKVLLVANESKFVQIDKDADDAKKEWVKRYLQTKEKTISDTLRFEADKTKTIKSILDLFAPELSQYKDQESVDEISAIFAELKTQNYRSFIFACQKTIDIFEKVHPQEDKNFADCIFYSIVAFCLRLKRGDNYFWPDKRKESSFELGTKKYPLFLFCYQYIMFHKCNTKEAELSKEILKELRLFDSSKSVNDPDLKIIYDYSNYNDDEVKEAVNSISKKLKKRDIISFSEYGRLVLELLHLSKLDGLGIRTEEYDEIETTMVENLCGKGEQISPDALSRIAVDSNDPCAKSYRSSMSKMIDSLLQKDNTSFYGFKYTVDTVKPFYDVIKRDPLSVIRAGGLISKMNIDKLMDVLKKCSSREINLMKDVFKAIYLDHGIPREDIDSLKTFRDKLQELKGETSSDAILKDNIMRFIATIEDCCNRGIIEYL